MCRVAFGEVVALLSLYCSCEWDIVTVCPVAWSIFHKDFLPLRNGAYGYEYHPFSRWELDDAGIDH